MAEGIVQSEDRTVSVPIFQLDFRNVHTITSIELY